MNHVTPSAMTTSQRAVVAVRALPLYEAEAKTRLREAGRLKGKANLPGAEKGQARVALCETPRARAAPAVEAAELSVQRMLKELLANAFDACEEAEIAPENHPGRPRRDHHHRHGPGIPAETVIEPADLGALDRGAAAGPSLVHRLELEQAFGEMVFEGDEGFGGGGHGADDSPKSASVVTYWSLERRVA